MKKNMKNLLQISILFLVFWQCPMNAQILNKDNNNSYLKYKKIGEELAVNSQLKTKDSIEIYKNLNSGNIVSIVKKGSEILSKPFGIVLYKLQEEKDIVIINYNNDYFEIKTDLFHGFVYKDFVQNTVEISKLIEVKEEESFNKRKEEIKKQQIIEEGIEKERLLKIALEERTRKENDAKIEKKNISKYGIKLYSKLKKGYVWLGMTKEMAIISLGLPDKINRSVGSWGINEQWVYKSRYYYFENGKMTSYQD